MSARKRANLVMTHGLRKIVIASAANSDAALSGVSILYGVVPGMLYISSALVVSRFRLTPARHAVIREELAAIGA